MFGRLLVGTSVLVVGICTVDISRRKSSGKTSESTSKRSVPRSGPRNTIPSAHVEYIKQAKCAESSQLLNKPRNMDYRSEADSIAQNTLNLYKSTDWKVAKTSQENGHSDNFQKEVRVFYKKSSEFDGHIYRAECEIEAPPEKILEYILPSPRGLRGNWDKTVKESEVIEKVDEDLIIARSATHSAAMGLISSRDFCDLIVVKRYPEQNIFSTNSKSIQRKDCPHKDGYVRAVNYHGGTFCSPVTGDTNKTHVVNIVQTDLCGMLPKAVVESALPTNLIDFFRDLDAALKDNIINSG